MTSVLLTVVGIVAGAGIILALATRDLSALHSRPGPSWADTTVKVCIPIFAVSFLTTMWTMAT